MPYRVRTVDVFTRRQLAGNQLAVVLDAHDLATGSMQAVAKEMNLAETKFVMSREGPPQAADRPGRRPGRRASKSEVEWSPCSLPK